MFNFFAFISYACIVSFTPGPNNFMAMAYAGKNGYRKAFPFLLGVATGFFLILTLSVFFNRLLLQVLPKAQLILTSIGTAFMLYLAYKFSGIKMGKAGDPHSTEEKLSIPLNFETGVLLQFINPKGILYGISVISSFLAPYFPNPITQLAFSILLAGIALASTSSWALFGSIFNRFLSKYERPFNIAMSLLLVYGAITISGLLH